MIHCNTFIIPNGFDGKRLDSALSIIFPESGLRLRRRYCEEGFVQVNGRLQKPGYKVHEGQEVQVHIMESDHSLPEIGIIQQTNDMAALFKPARVHSASIAGKDTANVESKLEYLFPECSPVLLNRLDYQTSGLLLVALNDLGCENYQSKESEGVIKKYYMALVEGRFDGMATIKKSLDTDNRKVSKVLDTDNPDERRWTEIHALGHDRERNLTLLKCMITKGARHQIRAHLASIHHPIVGDSLYGNGGAHDTMHLHHHKVEMDDFIARVDIPWANAFLK